MDCVSSDTQLTQSECFEPLNRAAMVEPALLSTSDIIHSLDVEVSDDNVAVQVGEEAVHNGNQVSCNFKLTSLSLFFAGHCHSFRIFSIENSRCNEDGWNIIRL